MSTQQNILKKQQKISRLVQQGKLSEAIQLLRPLCRKQPGNPSLWLSLASLCGRNGDLDGVIQACQKVLQLDRNQAIAHSLLGSANAQLGRPAAALEHFEQARRLRPDDAGILNNYGNALYLQGRLEEAKDALERAVQLQPDYADAHNNLGNVCKALNENGQAIQHYQRALQLNPGLFETHINLGDIFIGRVGNPPMAQQHYEAARRLRPHDIEAAAGVANVHRFQGRLDRALDVIREIQALHPDEDGPLAGEADIMERQGRHEEAFRICRQMLDRGTTNPMAIEVLLRICRKFDACDEAADHAETTLSSGVLKPSGRETLHFGLGHLYDRQGDYARAFDHYKAGNEALDIPFDSAGFRQRIDSLIQAFSQERLQSLPRSGIASRRPVFIVGMPRSGTSLTEQILASHSAVAGAGELNKVNDIVTALSDQLAYPEEIDRLDRESLSLMGNDYLALLDEYRQGESYVTDKMPHNFLNLGLIALLLPGARIIHCVRDPRDTCLSIYFQNFGWLHPYGTRLEWLGGYYREYVRLMRHWQTVLDLPLLTVQYEALVADQETMTRRMLDFLGLEWEDACLDFHKSERTVATASYDQVRQKIYHKSRARWKNYKPLIAPLIDALGECLHETSPSTAEISNAD